MGSLIFDVYTMTSIMYGVVIVLLFSVSVFAEETEIKTNEEKSGDRLAKLLPIFQVVRFPNDICDGGTLNGTCFTAEECSNLGGKNDGSCASGFGVCCTFTLACGGESSANNTYLVQAATTAQTTTSCTYKICKASTNICRIRLDLNTLVLAGPEAGDTISPNTVVTTGGGIGDCYEDTFYVTAPGSMSSPIICGTNSGAHMYLDASDDCNTVYVNIGGTTTTSRSWNIHVRQYACGDDDLYGWPGCLQYYTGLTNALESFNFPTATTLVAATTHLSDQYYDICIRRAAGYCSICYHVGINPNAPAVIAQASFGVSGSSDQGAAK